MIGFLDGFVTLRWKMNYSVKFTIPSDTRYLAPLRQMMSAISAITGRKSFPKKALQACTLALIEAVDNAIFHAHKRRRNLNIDVAVNVNDSSIVLEVTDRGRGLNHLRINKPKLLATRGRGLFLMQNLVDEVKSMDTQSGHKMILTYKL